MRDIILAIETSNPSAWTPASPVRPGVAVGRTGSPVPVCIGTREIDPSRKQEDDLMVAIEAIMKELGVAPARLAGVAVSIGPGGFTSVRIAVTTARMIAEATGAACYPVPTAMVVARRVEHGGRPFAVALASKGPTAHITSFDGEGMATGEGRLCDADEFERLGINLLVADHHLSEGVRDRALARRVEIVAPVFDPVACLEASALVAARDPVDVLPIYPREPEAVTKWRQLHPPKPGAQPR